MNNFQYKTSLYCRCEKKHTCDIEHIYIETNAIERLKILCQEFDRILLVADENTYCVAGKKVENSLIDAKEIRKTIFCSKKILVPDEQAINKIATELNDIDLIIGIGSGVIQDLCKYVSYSYGLPYIIVATAPSMDGYASKGAALILNGMKVTVQSCLPKAIIADIDILKDAPIEMIVAGYGDIIGKYSALCDWELSKIILDEYFCDYIYGCTYNIIDEVVNNTENILRRNAEGIQKLMEALIFVGIMMSFADSSRPASGSEHILAHFFEVTGIIKSEPYYQHGINVAFSSVITAMLRDQLLNTSFKQKTYTIKLNQYIEKMKNIYGELSESCIKLQKKAGLYNQSRENIYRLKEVQIKEILKKYPSVEKIIEITKNVGLNIDDFYNMYSREKIKNAVFYGKDLKDRFTILWMYFDFYGTGI